MSTELIEIASNDITCAISQDSEYDDTLEIPDSLEIIVDENGKTIQISKEEIEYANNKEGIYTTKTLIRLIYIFHFLFL